MKSFYATGVLETFFDATEDTFKDTVIRNIAVNKVPHKTELCIVFMPNISICQYVPWSKCRCRLYPSKYRSQLVVQQFEIYRSETQ